MSGRSGPPELGRSLLRDRPDLRAIGPAFYSFLIGNGTNRTGLTIGYIVGGGIMITGGLVEIAFGINADGRSPEEVATPLTEIDV